jgi:putative peptidoglycan lipid II flippase
MSLIKAAATVSGLTLISRVTGLIRDTLIASIFGVSALTDAFFVAWRLPNLLRRLFAEGAFAQAFVPILVQAKTAAGSDPNKIKPLLSNVSTALFWSLFVVAALGVVAAPGLVWLMASGLPEQAWQPAVTMTRWMFPYIFFISLVALAASILNTWKHFAIPAFAPVLLNLCFIAASLTLTKAFSQPIYALAAGVVFGGIAQLGLQVWALKKRNLLPSIFLDPRPAFADSTTRKVISQMVPALLGVSVAQISLIINTHIASRLQSGSVSWITYADRLMEFPTALLGVALGTVLLPSLAKANSDGDSAKFSSLIDWGLRLSILLAVPATVGLALMAEPLTAFLFHYGRFSANDVAMTQFAVLGYAVGLVGLISIKILAPGFYAAKDIKTPVKVAIGVLILIQVLNLILVPWLTRFGATGSSLGHVGLTLAISIGALVNAGVLAYLLIQKKMYKPLKGWRLFCLQVLGAGLAMAAHLSFFSPRFDWVSMQSEPFRRIMIAGFVIVSAASVYGAVLLILGINPKGYQKRAT